MLELKGSWKKKSSTVMECQEIALTHFIPTVKNCVDSNISKRLELPKVNKAGQAMITTKFQEQASYKVSTMEVQGHLATFLDEEKTNMALQSLFFCDPNICNALHYIIGLRCKGSHKQPDQSRQPGRRKKYSTDHHFCSKTSETHFAKIFKFVCLLCP